MQEKNALHQGLLPQEVILSRAKHGTNQLSHQKQSGLLRAVANLLKEPMVLLLLAAAILYFLSGETGDGIFMVAAILLVSAISLYQDARSRNALEKLKQFTSPGCKVIRAGSEENIPSAELVVNDVLVVEEGNLVPADGLILQSNDFLVNESILTGEPVPVEKAADSSERNVYMGTTVAGGRAVVRVTTVGNHTKLGLIGKSMEDIGEEKTPLEIQIAHFVKRMVLAGVVVFVIVWAINFFQSRDLYDSLLKALTLAMSILPEEIPVAFASFMALGAWRLMKMGVVVKQTKTVETLGSATVICVDKTGTITTNKMELAATFVLPSGKETETDRKKELIRMAMWASEPTPFDPMEIALHQAYAETMAWDERTVFSMVHEYPLGGKPPMMTHVFRNKQGEQLVAVKGAPEALLRVAQISEEERAATEAALLSFAQQGYRVLGVGTAQWEGNHFPAQQEEFPFQFMGLVAFYDPPKANIKEVLTQFYEAGIQVKIITGDNPITTAAIARQIGFREKGEVVTGDALMLLNETELQEKVHTHHLFARMFPEAKLRIINALKARREIVAMTGDGVNDGPALKAAHIGVAMGKKGSELARQAASLVLANDDLSKMVDAVAMGRRIYMNLKKAIQYIISIHIPIILTVFIPLALGWVYPNIFSPVHIIFLELIMGPTCSIIYENEPLEKNAMKQLPRPLSNSFFQWRELTTSMLQGLLISVGTLLVYQYAVRGGESEATTRTMIFVCLIVSNITLTLVNRSFYYSLLTTFGYRNPLILLVISVTGALLGLLLFVPVLRSFFELQWVTAPQLFISSAAGFSFVIWYEAIKWWKRRSKLPQKITSAP